MVQESSVPADLRTALVLGATGMVGRHLLALLRREPRYGRVLILSRRPLSAIEGDRGEEGRDGSSRRPPGFVVGSAPPDNSGPAVEVHLVDFDRLEAYAPLFVVDDLFCCLGTTIRKAGSREAFRRVDLEYPREAARLGREAGARRFLIISAAGADPRSPVFYHRVKGEVEEAVALAGYPRAVVRRPSLRLGEREERRPRERMAEWILKPLGPLMRGPLARYRPVEAERVARVMVRRALAAGPGGPGGKGEGAAGGPPPEVEIVESDRIRLEGRPQGAQPAPGRS